MSDDQAAIEAHNARELWRDVGNHLTVAYQAVEQAQGALEDLDRESYADQLDTVVDLLRRAANDAAEAASEQI